MANPRHVSRHLYSCMWWGLVALAILAMSLMIANLNWLFTCQYGNNYFAIWRGCLCIDFVQGPAKSIQIVKGNHPDDWGFGNASWARTRPILDWILWPKYEIQEPRSRLWDVLTFGTKNGKLSRAYGRLTYYQIRIPLWIPALPGLGLIAIRMYRVRRYRDWWKCATCNYNLRENISGRCPECGTAITEEQKKVLRERGRSADGTNSSAPSGREI
jgi:predicted RNA-binding Zn-ribbon protein involved in translation (DUF1610 family)